MHVLKKFTLSRSRLLPLFVVAATFSAHLFAVPAAFSQKRRKPPAATTTTTSAASRSVVVRTEPEAAVWLDELRRGTTDAEGKLTIENVKAGRHTLRVRAVGFKERALPLAPAARGEVAVKLVRTSDEAELAFQQAEVLREKARDEESRRRAAEAYQRAIELRPRNAAAHVGLARVLLDLEDYGAALDAVDRAREVRPNFAEASAVEGRILRKDADNEGAMRSFRRSIREARGFQPEAHTGLALVLEDKGRYEEAAAEFRTAVAQLADTEPALYQLLGSVYERLEKYKEAVAAYEKYLQLAPEGNLAPAVRSIIEQLRRQAAEQEAAN